MTVKVRSHCPIAFALDHVGDKWSLLILRDIAFKGRSSFSDLKAGGEGIATNILSQRLEQLCDSGLLAKFSPKGGRRKTYRLTEKGRALVPMMVEMILWSARFDPATAADQGFVKAAKRDKAALIAEWMGR